MRLQEAKLLSPNIISLHTKELSPYQIFFSVRSIQEHSKDTFAAQFPEKRLIRGFTAFPVTSSVDMVMVSLLSTPLHSANA
jgi:hypothetical protein